MNWQQFLIGNPWRTVVIVVVLLVGGPFVVSTAASLLGLAINTLAGPLLLAGIIIYAFRWMIGRR